MIRSTNLPLTTSLVFSNELQKEEPVGKPNLLLLHLKRYSEAAIQDSIAYVKDILDENKRKLLEHALMDGFNDLPKP